jgi:hypothetical protein
MDSRLNGDDEKREMLQMLKRLEEDDLAAEDEDDHVDSLVDRLDGVDLGPLS